MPAPAWENPDDFLDPDEFATAAVIQFLDGGQRDVVGIFDDPFLNAQLGEFEMDSSRPRLLCKEPDLAGVVAGDQVEIDAVTYEVLTGPQSTGDGFAVLELAKA